MGRNALNIKDIPTKEFMVTFLSDYSDKTEYGLHERMRTISHKIHSLVTSWSDDRQQLEQEWVDCWAEYFSNSRSASHLRDAAIRTTTSDVATDWRHKVPTGKAFEIVETVNSYLQSAFFPNQQWFDMYPKQHMDTVEWEDVLTIVRNYSLAKLKESNFQDWWDVFCRQMLVVGTSVLALPWRYDAITTYKNTTVKKKGKSEVVPKEVLKVLKNGFDFSVIDMFDFFIDPNSSKPREGNVIRRIKKRRGEVVRLMESGVYPLAEMTMIENAEAYNVASNNSSHVKDKVKWISGIDTTYNNHSEDMICLYEFWGDLQIGDVEFVDICATIIGDNLISIMPNPYWGGFKPFVIGSFLNTHDSPYGMSLLQPVLGQLHKLFEIQNHRLDVDELTINPMLLVVNDGSIDFQNLYVAPGRVLQVEDTETDVRPLQLPNTTQVAVQDEGLLENRVDKVTGVGAYVGVNSGRQAERVTAEEVSAQRDAGGNRLGRYHKHIEETALYDFLTKMYAYLQQFVLTDEIVRIKKQVDKSFKEQYDYFYVGQEELQYDLDVLPIGSDYIVDKEFELRQRIDFYTFVAGNPQLSQFINWQEAVKDLSRRFLKQDWEKFLKIPEPQPPVMSPDQGQPPMGQQLPPEALPPGALPPDQGQQMQFKDSQAFADQLSQNPEQAVNLIDQTQKANQTL
jgi:hypothetical protein